MSADSIIADSKNLDFGYRTAKGEWRPPYSVKSAPLFVWPSRPREALKWALGYPGFLWPTNLAYVLIATLTWLFLRPELSRCVELKASWIGQVYIRNLVMLWLIAGGWHLLLYTFKVEGTNRKYDPRWLRVGDRNFLFRNQLYDNIFWSCVSGCTVWTGYEVLYLWGIANHHIPYVNWTEHPLYCTLCLVAIPFWREFHFYWFHRAIHWKPLYRSVHHLHHKNVNPGPWSGLAMHPVEHVLYFSAVLISFVIPLHPIHFFYNAQKAALEPASTHNGFEGPLLNGKIPAGSYFHYLHHRYFVCNYGGDIWPFDKLFRTFRDGLSDVLDPNLRDSQFKEQEVVVSNILGETKSGVRPSL